MKIIITMAGNGSRFKKAGYKGPKHELLAGNNSLFWWSIQSLKAFFEDEFYFIVRKNNFSKYKLETEIKNLGIKKFKIVVLQEETEGQASTVMSVDAMMDNSDAFLVFNIDTSIKSNYIKKEEIIQMSGSIPLFFTEGIHWSFAKIDEKTGLISEVAEKRPISNWGSVGLYYFSNWYDYKTAYYKKKHEIQEAYGEVYIAPLYNELIQQDKPIKPIILPKESFAVLGTPRELEEFKRNHLSEFEKNQSKGGFEGA
ncbi:glycosyltransferase family 2 protein [Enterococcus alishanensis]